MNKISMLYLINETIYYQDESNWLMHKSRVHNTLLLSIRYNMLPCKRNKVIIFKMFETKNIKKDVLSVWFI